jgi:hypothetical protein
VNRKQKDTLGAYVRWVANELGLRDWTFELVWEPPEEENAVASVQPTEGRKVAVVKFCSDFLELKPEDQRNCVVHELIHCHHVGATDMVRLDLLKHLSQQSYEIFWGGFVRQIEYMTDGLAEAFAPHMPLIDWPS